MGFVGFLVLIIFSQIFEGNIIEQIKKDVVYATRYFEK